MYALLDDRILLNEDWWDYIKEHYCELCKFATESFVDEVRAAVAVAIFAQ